VLKRRLVVLKAVVAEIVHVLHEEL
jgi:hypothetical protein